MKTFAKLVFAAFALLALGLAGPAFATSKPKASKTTADFGGVWESKTDKNWTYTLDLEQDGNEVEGTYVSQDGSTGEITGTVKGRVLRFEWDHENGRFTGTGQFKISSDGETFSGVYDTDETAKLAPEFLQGTWSGKRKGPVNFGGTWDTKTDKNWTYVITLKQKGDNVTGGYVAQNGSKGSIAGHADGKVLEFDWTTEDGFEGTGTFTLSKNGDKFRGEYDTEPDSRLDANLLTGTWDGTRRK